MLIVALACFVLAVLLWRAKWPAEEPNNSRLYRIDNRVAAFLLVVLAVTFVVLAWTSRRPLF